MLDETLPVTLQHQLREKLTGRIAAGEWKTGDKMPSERAICEEYGVSRMTVREVLGDLERDGVLMRMRGKGTFVAGPKFRQELGGFYSFSEEIAKSGLSPHTRLLEFFTLACPPEVADKLGLADGELIHRIGRLRYIDDDIFAWEVSYVPRALVPGLTDVQVQEHGLYNSIRMLSGLIADEAEEEFEAAGCNQKAAHYLRMRPAAAVLHLTRLTRARGKCIEFCESYIRGDKYKYKVVLK